MSKILTNVTGMHEHYLSLCYQNTQMTEFGTLNITGSGTVTGQTIGSMPTALPVFGSNTKIFAVVDSITDIPNDMTVTIKSAAATAITRVNVGTPGTGYTVGTAVTTTGGTGSGFTGYIAAVNATGGVTDIAITNPGSYTTLPTGFSATGGTGLVATGVLGTATALGSASIVAHAPIDAAFPVMTSGGAWTVAPGYGFTVDLTNAAPGVVVKLFCLDDTSALWFDMGLNYNEGVSFEDGVMAAPVARGWSLTDHAKRVPASNSWSVSQLYCSQMEGIANLRGKTIMIKDEIRTDGGSTVKETTWVFKATVQNVAIAIGGGGGGAAADAVNASGYYSRAVTYTADATAMTATK